MKLLQGSKNKLKPQKMNHKFITTKSYTMKILNILKKENKKTVVTATQKLDKTQLQKVIGGGGSDIPDEVQGPINTSRTNIRHS